MNKEIEYIQSITSVALLTASGQWSYLSTPPEADEMCIRQVTYTSADAGTNLYVVNSNVGYMGVVSTTRGFTSNPGTRIQLHHSTGQLQFQLQVPTAGGLVPATPTAGDMIAINIDFIKYRR
ncbi:MAG: hypothetical protein P4L81_03890 [Candidatus Pacebacteria bacterium]|nr:hypothetical protein [Candidatus Paceibacterota bacterium]